MSKKQKTNKINPRRTKGRVYSLPKSTEEIIDALANASFPGIAGPLEKRAPESICDKARRLANEAEETKKKERSERELAFMKRMFETDDLAGAGVVMHKVREDGTIEYLICGRRWVYGEEHLLARAYSGYLINIDYYMGFRLNNGFERRVNNLKDFGALLQRMEKREAELRAKYPENLWGWFKSKW